MNRTRMIVALALTYAVFAVLLNSVGTVILQSIESFHVTKVAASSLEGFKDLSIAATSFLLAAQLPRFGLRRAMIAALGLVALACLAMPLVPGFWTTRLMFLAVGVAFGVTKVSVYSFVGLLTDDSARHASLLNVIEGVFMLGVLSGYWVFAAFIDPQDPGGRQWLAVYYVLAAASLIALALLAVTPFDESAVDEPSAAHGAGHKFAEMIALAWRPLTLSFIVAIFCYVLVEQGIGSWLPTFNRELLGLSAPMSVQAASIFAICLAAGRLGAGVIVRRTGWFPLVCGCLAAMAVLIVVVLPLATAHHGPVTGWAGAPIAAFLFPMIGLTMAPIYPALNSAILSSMPPREQPAMVGLIVVFSALGGTTGSFIVGHIFAAFQGTTAFYVLLVPIAALAAASAMVRRGAAR
ncbi:MAG: major Facilitator Superfamily protein [Sphingomonas bacterium]|uniref:MFS transporter n=1 Tax=Sphingomonas bacterium TaxID=1895847 RepID=UPI0026183B55|nr:MFS transporter [Sphingomonas bacterium]MDB5712050.1 major Facilitator Superfamily protein [Sphingomonas bacterium]